MAADDLCYADLVEVGRRIQAKRVSSVEVTQAVLDRIARLDGRLKSYATLTADLALAQAKQADAEIGRGAVRGPLHGVPIAVKDLCHTKGIPTAAGMAIHKDYRPARDATVVARLREAGAVLLGKLQMTEGAFAQHHPSIDAPINPWSAAHWTGVSSSGSGVATAAGLCYGALGTDTLGSIRFPSTMNGLTGVEADLGEGQPCRRVRSCRVHGPYRSNDAQRRRRGRHAGRHCRRRLGRSDRRTGTRARLSRWHW